MTEARVRLRPEIASIAPYRQGRPAAADAYKLSSNENPYEPLPAVREAVARASINRYPDAAATALRARLAERFDVTPERVQVGAGSVSILAQLVSAAAGPGDEVVYSWRSFEAYPGLVAVSGATSVPVPNTPDHRHDLVAMAAAVTDRTRVVIVCSPNNPTGTVVTAQEFADFMAAVPRDLLVVLDEAYVEFVTDEAAVNGANVVDAYPNLVILRTFSKAYGLAGLRIGYAVGPEHVMDAARATAIPLSVIDQAQQAALASLDSEAELFERVRSLVVQRDRTWAALAAQGWEVPPSQANFLWLPTGPATTAAAAVFESNGVVVRALGEGVRVSVGEAESVDKLLRAAQEVIDRLRTDPPWAALD